MKPNSISWPCHRCGGIVSSGNQPLARIQSHVATPIRAYAPAARKKGLNPYPKSAKRVLGDWIVSVVLMYDIVEGGDATGHSCFPKRIELERARQKDQTDKRSQTSASR
jgi:hypothetical protein